MSRIYPTVASKALLERIREDDGEETAIDNLHPNKLTVWKRSSMAFQGTDGFTVFDRRGRLVFRVDNYSRTKTCGEGGGVVLMDGAGNALLTLKPQMWSIQNQWDAYKGDESCGCSSISTGGDGLTKYRLFSMRRTSRHLLHSSKAEAEVFLRQRDHRGCRTRLGQSPDFTVEGSFNKRSCCIRSCTGETVARICRKRVKNCGAVLSNDVFSMVVEPGCDADIIMGFVIVLDRICCKSVGPILCSFD